MANLVLATTWHERPRRKLAAVKAVHEGDDETLHELLDVYLLYESKKGARISDKTRRAYAVGVKDWLRYCWPDRDLSPTVHLLRVTRDDVKRWLLVSAERLSPASIQLYLAAVRSFYAALRWADATDSDPTADVRAPSDPRPRHARRDLVALGDYRAMLDAADSALDTLLLRLLGDQGLRNAEVCSLDLKDIDLRQNTLTVQRGKGGKKRTLPLTKMTRDALRTYLGERPETDDAAVLVHLAAPNIPKKYVGRRLSGIAIRRRIGRVAERAGTDYKGAHALRHTAGTRLYQATGDLYRVAQILGHSDVNTSSIYAKMDLSGLRETLEGLGDV